MSGPAPLRSADQLTEADPASRLRPVLAAKPLACPLRAGGRLARRPLGSIPAGLSPFFHSAFHPSITLDVINEKRYVLCMIMSFKDEETAKIFRGQFARKLPQDIQRVAARKLEQLHAATILDTLRVPPGNRLEALTRDRQGQHSMHVNDQWRVCFVWRDGNAFDVEIVDYH